MNPFFSTLSLIPLPYLISLEIISPFKIRENYFVLLCRPNIPLLRNIILKVPKRKKIVVLDLSSSITSQLPSFSVNPETSLKVDPVISIIKVNGGYTAIKDNQNQCVIELKLDSKYPFFINIYPGIRVLRNVQKNVCKVILPLFFE